MTSVQKLPNIRLLNFYKYSHDYHFFNVDPDLGIWAYTYDLAGNLISQVGGGGNLVTGDSFYREYNGLGQLKSVKGGNSSNGKILEEYFYDANGDRIKVIRTCYSEGCSNETIYTPYKEWMQIRNSSGTFNFYYIYQDGVLVSRLNPDGTKYFYHPDHLGSTTLITDQNGNVVENEFYSAYGESLTANNDEENKLFTGQFKDTTGMYYFGARYYLVNPPIFISGDPEIQNVFDPQFLNHYSYVRNNPFKQLDPNGKVTVLFEGGSSGQTDPNNGVYQIFNQLNPEIRSVSRVITKTETADDAYEFVMQQLEKNSNQPINIVGHSWGGGEALELQDRIESEGRNVNYVATIDPYSLKPEHIKLFEFHKYDPSVNENYYQIVGFLTGFRMRGIKDKLVWSTHTKIDSNSNVQNRIVERITKEYSNYQKDKDKRQINKDSYNSGIGYVTADGRIYPTNNPNWKPTLCCKPR